jgi:hypothetical protein
MTSQFDAKDDATKRKQTSPDSESSSTCGPQPSQSNEDASRRKFLRTAVGGAVAGLVTGAGMELSPEFSSGTVVAHPRRGAGGIAGGQ